jgi:hypothetical protein
MDKMKSQALESVSASGLELEQQKARLVIMQLIANSETWFNWLLKRVDKFVDGGLQPYIN